MEKVLLEKEMRRITVGDVLPTLLKVNNLVATRILQIR
jgi:hypothetical protein